MQGRFERFFFVFDSGQKLSTVCWKMLQKYVTFYTHFRAVYQPQTKHWQQVLIRYYLIIELDTPEKRTKNLWFESILCQSHMHSSCCHILEICKLPFCIISWISCFSILKCSHKHYTCHITVKNTQWKHLGKHLFWKIWHKIFPLSIQFLLFLSGDFFFLMKKFYYALMKASGIWIRK